MTVTTMHRHDPAHIPILLPTSGGFSPNFVSWLGGRQSPFLQQKQTVPDTCLLDSRAVITGAHHWAPPIRANPQVKKEAWVPARSSGDWKNPLKRMSKMQFGGSGGWRVSGGHQTICGAGWGSSAALEGKSPG